MKPSIIFMSPVIPSFSGNGLAMRAAHNLRALAGSFTVHLLVIALYGGQNDQPPESVLPYCATWKRIDAPLPVQTTFFHRLRQWFRWGRCQMPVEWAAWHPDNEQQVRAFFAETPCLYLWVFRFYLLPWARTWLDEGKKAWIDLDELESGARESQANLFFSLGQHEKALSLQREAQLYRDLEPLYLHRFERILTASEKETTRVQAGINASSVATWPNIISLPIIANHPVSEEKAEWKLLFIGSLGHFPNREAIRYAAQKVLPRLRTLLQRPVVLQVAGAGAEAHQAAFGDLDHVEWLGTVPDVTPVYGAADLVIVPLHAGGGTRIKILEAFAHQKAVISTRLGAEGLDVAHGHELLLADTPDEMAACCAELLADADKRTRLIRAGLAYVTAHHSRENLEACAQMLRQTLDQR